MLRNPKLAPALIALAIPALAIPALSSAGDFETSLKAKLKGSKEVPGPGDPNGKGKIEILIDTAENKNVCFDLELKKLSGASAGHIHKGDPDEAGKIKVLLFEVDPPLGNGAYDGCVKAKDKLAEKIASKPDKFYVNIHNEDYPDGAIRGQLKAVAG